MKYFNYAKKKKKLFVRNINYSWEATITNELRNQ